MASSNWAIILCKFADDISATPSIDHYLRLFTSAGTGALNMVDFFLAMSHGQVDLGGSQVFGWFTLTLNAGDYAGNVSTVPAGKVNRDGLVAACWQAAINGGVDLAAFDGTVISMNGQVDLFGYVGGKLAFRDSLSLSPSPLGQEMGHGFGLDQAWRNGSEDDYADPTDVMSVYSAYSEPFQEWGIIGPAVSAVLVHRFSNNHSYVMSDTTGETLLTAGSVFEIGAPNFNLTGTLRMEVLSIDDASKMATIKVTQRPAPHLPDLVGVLLGAVASGGGGGILIGGRVVPVPPRGPEVELLRSFAEYLVASGISDIGLRRAVERSALDAMASIIARTRVSPEPIRSPGPRIASS